MPSDTKRERDLDAAEANSFPASDPPATMGGEGSTRAVPPQTMMAAHRRPPCDALTLRRRFPTTEAAKLALESMVRSGPVDRDTAEMSPLGREVELRILAQPEDCQRLRGLLARA
jgi:hypothetical protein